MSKQINYLEQYDSNKQNDEEGFGEYLKRAHECPLLDSTWNKIWCEAIDLWLEKGDDTWTIEIQWGFIKQVLNRE